MVISVLRALQQAGEARKKHQASGDETEEQRRVREIQERIRRIAAERSGRTVAPPLVRRVEPVPPREVALPPAEVFEAPLHGGLEIEREEAPALEPPTRNAELERQVRLAAELRAVTERRLMGERRSAEVSAAQLQQAASEDGLRSVARARLLEDLRDPQSVRRAIVLREVLGAPVGLR
ncbi:MAG TPA: hypothetical protein VHD62_18585 [Opitutaceae bacterium]|nr:hypothetical protein [Opitutaceae bacterium]